MDFDPFMIDFKWFEIIRIQFNQLCRDNEKLEFESKKSNKR